MKPRHAREIRRGINDARSLGWSQPPRMVMDPSTGLRYVDALYGRAWEQTMRARGLYPPRPPSSPAGA